MPSKGQLQKTTALKHRTKSDKSFKQEARLLGEIIKHELQNEWTENAEL
jgi:hypothetical protein